MVDINNNAAGLSTENRVSSHITDASGNIRTEDDTVAVEHIMELSVNGVPAVRLSCTPGHLPELVLGRLYSQGIIDGLDDVDRIFICGEGNIAEVYLKKEIEAEVSREREATCCTGNKTYMENACRREAGPFEARKPESSVIFEMAEAFEKDTALHRSTGGTHSCHIRYPDGTMESYEDISRHNALDKALGAMLLKEYKPSECVVYTSGRVAADMAEKCISAGIPVLVSKAAPTTAALDLARRYRLILIGKARPDSYRIWE